MDTITHALIPVICVRLAAGRKHWLGRWGLVQIGLAGALPDLLNPHLSLESRMISWSHGLPFWIAFSVIILITSFIIRDKLSPQVAACMSAAYILHIGCDAISGGVDLFYPFGTWILGYYWVDPMLWIPIDIVLILVAYMMFRILPGLKNRREAEQDAT
jgi:membrane-bound metal-dependent hydrolase YbcI (DUF457 family)